MTRSLRMLRNPLWLAVTVVLAWGIGAFLIMPNVTLLGEVFTDDTGSITLRAFDRLFGSERAVRSLWNSVLLATILSITVNIVGIFLVLVTRFYAIRGARLLWIGYASTLVCGGIVLVFGYKQVYGPTGAVTRLAMQLFPELDPNWFSGMFAVVAVMTFASTGNHLLFLAAAISKVDLQTIEAARMMGASDLSILRRIVLPVLKPMIFAITILTFLGGLGALAAPQVLGGRDFQTVSPMILAFATTSTSQDLAATLAILLGIATVVLLAVLNRVERGGVYFSVSKVPTPLEKQRIHNPVVNAVTHVIAYALFVVYVLPPALVVLYSFTEVTAISSGTLSASSFTVDNYVAVFTTQKGLQPFLVSVAYGIIAATVALALMVFAARMVQHNKNTLTRVIEYLLHIPWFLPSTMIALGLILTFNRPQPAVLGAVLTGSFWILAIAYIIGKIPFTFRLLKAAFAGVPNNLEEAASMLGASQMYTFRRVLLPLIAPTAAAISALNFTSLLDDYDSAIFLSHPLLQPLGIVIKNATSAETISDGVALSYVYTVLIMVISTAAMWAVYGRKPRRRSPLPTSAAITRTPRKSIR
ncbi:MULTISPECIES: iron ABC transporter permease [unclassified Microbacterium]|uniref:ABC transporter permease n=1 Tax=unclassified Microbacterium TaxID=2609290 RepID=UPI00214C03F6|nr:MULTISPECIES: iron ABC transporter permease [unclassified Microbacterium]MCR2782995.1 iron ABC transporter permease [Microbacterium sp. zg.B96]WIM16118.1 iron ABC transporter permease [Microbacterium sp. zg-B96]